MRARPLAIGAVIAVLSATTTGSARGDGDPASDFLLVQPDYLPSPAPSRSLSSQLTALADAAASEGFPIRVAVIRSSADLGSIPELMGRPGLYARYLGQELRLAYQGRLLVVMPQGYGYSMAGHPLGGPVLAGLPRPAGDGANALTRAAIVAVRRIAAAGGHPLVAKDVRVTAAAPASGSGVWAAAGAIAMIAVVSGGWLWLARAGRRRPQA
jgi:hypothetical protein